VDLGGTLHAFSTCIVIGRLKLFDEEKSVWDTHRGRAIPESLRVDMLDFEGLDLLAASLREARWRYTTRTSYNRWFKCWQSFAKAQGCVVMPAESAWLQRFFVFLTLYYAAATVQISACAIVALHRLNGFPSPMTEELKSLMKAIEAVGICGAKSKKFIVDGAFVVTMCQSFLEDFPTFDKELFDPSVVVKIDAHRSIMWLRGVAMILLGLELGARAGEVVAMTVCCWQARTDGSVFVEVKLAKNGKNGEISGAVLVPGKGDFGGNFSAISFFEEFWFPFLSSQGWGVSKRCISGQFRTSICDHCSPLFPVCKGTGGVPDPINRSQVTSSVKKWADRIGRDSKNYSAISFRRGSVSLAAAAKVDRNIRKKHGRWKTDDMQDVYTEVSTAEAKEYGKALRNAVLQSRRSQGKSVKFSEFQT
jgi:hypothetical protein